MSGVKVFFFNYSPAFLGQGWALFAELGKIYELLDKTISKRKKLDF